MTRRFYVPADTIAGDSVEIDGDLAHRIVKVLRLRAGDEIALFDGSGTDARVRIDAVMAHVVTATVVERAPGPMEPRVGVSLYQSITKGERFEWLLEKGTEIGVSRFVPLITARSVVRTAGEGNRMERWRRIVVEATEQCERSRVPEIEQPMSLDDALRAATGVLLLPYEAAGETARTVQAALDASIDELFACDEVSVFIGPEGGYEPAEVERAKEHGALVVTMGQRVMRSETAGMVAATLVMHAVGALG
ncbi:MAG TPA: 16S rRNA (uracil(1498)-N(3))-methyltransferase [Dehalococcoidia bacterium]|nr:16S rRNA (uracil(1498)-N(3))-methyltransferase [Dehalococcoidia bacterium]